ncbi:MAG: RNA polymerase sigma factor [Clostridiales bacterium]|nr:RNA polymerase sigma factor [Clostridiales bacterium]
MTKRETESGKRLECFKEAYERDFNYVYSYVLARAAGDVNLSAEIVQDSFAAAWQSFESFRQASSFRTWVCSIARNKLHEYYRRKTIRNRLEVTDASLPEDQAAAYDLEAEVIEGETRKLVAEALAAIKDIYRFALVMKYTDGLSVKEIAKVLQRSPKAVDGILQRAKCCFAKEYSGIMRDFTGEVQLQSTKGKDDCNG